jgi:hypothetical protein
VKYLATKKVEITIFVSLSLVVVVGSGMDKNPDPG